VRDLKERTKRFALAVVRLYCSLPKTTEAQVLGKQLLRAGTSVGAHYRESQRAKSVPDFISKIEGALQELEETCYWMELLREARIAEAERFRFLAAEAEELTAILVAAAKSAKKRTAQSKG